MTEHVDVDGSPRCAHFVCSADRQISAGRWYVTLHAPGFAKHGQWRVTAHCMQAEACCRGGCIKRKEKHMEFTARRETASGEMIVPSEACQDGVPALTLVVPTRNEAGNIPELLIRLSKLPAGLLEEIVFVDDSDDETPAVIKEAAGLARVPVRLVHRPKGSRKGGSPGPSSRACAGRRGPGCA
jgi:hypothetical protein